MLEISTKKYLITKLNSWAACRIVYEARKTINGLDGNGLLKTYALPMEDKMVPGAFGRARKYGSNGPSNL